VAVAAGWLRYRTAAISDYGAAVVVSPTLANDPFWNSDPELSAARPAIIDAARQQVERSPGSAAAYAPSLFTLQLLAGDPAAAKAELAPLSAADRALYDQAVAAWQGLPGAEAALHQLAERHPLDVAPVGWCWMVAVLHNEWDLVARYGAWLSGGFEAVPPVARVVFVQPLSQTDRGVDRYASLLPQK
jgi:hypothetical protein